MLPALCPNHALKDEPCEQLSVGSLVWLSALADASTIAPLPTSPNTSHSCAAASPGAARTAWVRGWRMTWVKQSGWWS